MTQIALFNYAGLDTETRIIVQQRTSEIKTLVRRSAQDIIEIGQKLIEVKERLGHGNFGPWLEREFGWTTTTAWNFMQVAGKFSNFENLENFGASALYLLASPSTPEPARLEAIERAEAGEVITHKTAQAIVEDYKYTTNAVDIGRMVAPVIVPAPQWDDLEDEKDDDNRPSYVTVADEWGSQETIRIEPDEEISVVKTPHVARNSGNNEWYTPEPFILAARAVMGGIDCDPATSLEANRVVGASTIYTAETNGLVHDWTGRVWMNPPYASPLISLFCDKLSLEFHNGEVTEAIALVNNATETGWFFSLIDCASAVVFPQSRVKFWQPDGTLGAPLQGQAIIYLGGKPKTFLAEFRQFGWGAQL